MDRPDGHSSTEARPKATKKFKAKPKAKAKSKHRKGTTGPTDEQLRALPADLAERQAARATAKKPKEKSTKGWAKPSAKAVARKRAAATGAAVRKDRPIPKTKKFGAVKPQKAAHGRLEQGQPTQAGKPSYASGKPPHPSGKPHPSSQARPSRQARPTRSSFEPQRPAFEPMPVAPSRVTPERAPSEAKEFSSLDGVHARTAETLAKAGFTQAFPIQSAVIPWAVRGRDMLVQSPTGSGKTLAFGIPIVEQIKPGVTAPAALVLTPTRELAVQVAEDLTPLARGKNLAVVAVYGGAPVSEQARRASRSAIVVATPGRLADLMRTRRIDLRGVRVLVLDEADRMLDMGFQPQVDEIVAEMPGRRQTMLFSATLEGAVGAIAAAYTDSPEVVRNATAVGEGHKVDHVLLATTNGTKVDTVLDALDDAARDLAVVFVRTQHGADRLSARLREYGLRSTTIHGGMNQGQRQREYRRFQAGTCDTLVATDVFARGMDLDRITHVINYDLPEDADTYKHRAGRTGRAGRAGKAVTMVMPSQTRQIKQMVAKAGLPADLGQRIQKSSGKRWHQVPEEDRFNDRPEPSRREQRSANGSDRSRGGADRRPGAASASGAPGTGIVATYDDTKGFGFITPGNGGADVFFHRSSVAQGSGTAIARGATVSFELEEGTARERAATVRLQRGGDTGRGRQHSSDPRAARNYGPSRGNGPARGNGPMHGNGSRGNGSSGGQAPSRRSRARARDN